MKAKHVVQSLWAGIYTLAALVYVGLFVALGWYKFSGTYGRALTFNHVTGKGPKWLQSYWRYWAGHTVGQVVVTAPDKRWVLHHEYHHVLQYLFLGPFFLPLYLMGWLVAKLSGEDAYFMNPMEVAARRSADEPIDVKRKH